MKTRRRRLRWLRRYTKRMQRRQKGGIPTLVKLGTAALAMFGGPRVSAERLVKNESFKPGGTGIAGPLTTGFGPSGLTSRNSGFAPPAARYGSTALASRNTPSSLNLSSSYWATPGNSSLVSVPNTSGLWQPTTAPSVNTATNSVVFVSPAQIAATIPPEAYTTPSPVPGPVAQFVAPAVTILETASTKYLQNLAPVSAELVTATVAPQSLRQGIVIAGHNTLTNEPTTLPLIGTPLASANQQLSLDQYLEHCAVTGKCFLDIDMHKSGDTVISAHGGKFLGRIINQSEGSQGTQPILQKIHEFAKSHPNVSFTIRSENHGVSSSDISKMLTPEMQSQVATFSKHTIPTNGELQTQGKNVMYFLENSNETAIDQTTGIYEGGLVMAQNHYFVRSIWNRVKNISAASSSELGTLMKMDVSRLPKKPMCLFDGYVTDVGASPTGHMKQSNFVANFASETLPKVKDYLKSQGFDTEDMGCVVMVDNVDSNGFALQVGLQFAEKIEDPQARAEVIAAIPTVFVNSQEALNEKIADVYQRPIINAFERVGAKASGENVNLDAADIVVPTLSITALVGFFYMTAALTKKLYKAGKTSAAKALEAFLKKEVAENKELDVIVKAGAEASEKLVFDMDSEEDPTAPRRSPGSPVTRSDTGSEPGSASSPKRKKKKSGNLSNFHVERSAFGQAALRKPVTQGRRRGGTRKL